jgi:hypothetical protein
MPSELTRCRHFRAFDAITLAQHATMPLSLRWLLPLFHILLRHYAAIAIDAIIYYAALLTALTLFSLHMPLPCAAAGRCCQQALMLSAEPYCRR